MSVVPGTYFSGTLQTSAEPQQRSASSDWFLQAIVFVANLPLDESISDFALSKSRLQ
ncbi:hypothetical protein HDF14_003100 [Edaphobacter lichenicola]|jgi:hypothetical protein|uniref:Uncharacterized protein n=1 Tax=Tunturiibacter gelidiferens TaxID=3069689 RepID=A0A9X0U660_9BACT|nr:hypothetical protein [Edaphobacter lichenicola]